MPEKLTRQQRLIVAMGRTLGDLARMFDEAPRIRMLTRSEDHIEFTDARARQLAELLSIFALQAEEWE
jgi:hypothetical protein